MEMKPAYLDRPNTRRNVRGEDTRRKLVQAAMKLVAENGLGGLSLREVNKAAGTRNKSAAHYHFGSKLGIVRAVFTSIADTMVPAQEILYRELEVRMSRGERITAREALEAAYLPYLALIMHPSFGFTAARFVSRILVEADAEVQAVVNEVVSPRVARLLPFLTHALPGVPQDVITIRLLVTVSNVVHGLGDFPAIWGSPYVSTSGKPPIEFVHRFFEYVSGAAAAPVTEMEGNLTQTVDEILHFWDRHGVA